MNENDIYKLKYYKYKNKYLKQKNLLQEGGKIDFTGITAFIGNTVQMHAKYDIKDNNCLYKDNLTKLCEKLKTEELINLIGTDGVIFKNNENIFYEANSIFDERSKKNLSKNFEIINKKGVKIDEINKLLEEINNINFDPRIKEKRKVPLNWILIYDLSKNFNNKLLYSNE